MIFLPGNVYRTSTQAMMTPKMVFTTAAIIAPPMLSP
jgi:hypothetical protein